MNNDTLPREADNARPSWAKEARRNDDNSGGPWFVASVGRGYYLPGAGSEPGMMLDETDALTFELVFTPNDANGPREPFIEQLSGPFGLNAAFASADAMRRYARILLEVADDVDRVLGVEGLIAS